MNSVSESRHKNMAAIKSTGTKPELVLRKGLWAAGIRYRKNYKALPGKPDMAITKHKIAVFVDGELFHGKDWEVLEPQLGKGKNGQFWIDKVSRNMQRDDDNNKALLYMGWTVVRFWGKDILRDPDSCVNVIKEMIFEKMIAELSAEGDAVNGEV